MPQSGSPFGMRASQSGCAVATRESGAARNGRDPETRRRVRRRRSTRPEPSSSDGNFSLVVSQSPMADWIAVVDLEHVEGPVVGPRQVAPAVGPRSRRGSSGTRSTSRPGTARWTRALLACTGLGRPTSRASPARRRRRAPTRTALDAGRDASPVREHGVAEEGLGPQLGPTTVAGRADARCRRAGRRRRSRPPARRLTLVGQHRQPLGAQLVGRATLRCRRGARPASSRASRGVVEGSRSTPSVATPVRGPRLVAVAEHPQRPGTIDVVNTTRHRPHRHGRVAPIGHRPARSRGLPPITGRVEAHPKRGPSRLISRPSSSPER